MKFSVKLKLPELRLLLVVFALISCKKSEIKVGFMLPNTKTERYQIERDVFSAKGKELGAQVLFAAADNDEEKQIQQLQSMIKEGIDILVLDPVNRFRAAGMVRMAHDNGIKVISYDRLVANCNVDALVTFDSYAVGKKMADYALRTRPTGPYIILGGDKMDANAIMINSAIEKVLEMPIKSGSIKVIYKSFIESYSATDCENSVIKAINLSLEKPASIIVASGAMAQGVINVMQKFGFEKQVVITGQNGELNALKNILAGRQSMTIYKPGKKLASTTAEIAIKLAKGESVANHFKSSIYNGTIDVPTLFFDVISIDSTNLKSVIAAEGICKVSDLLN